jgi:hypothetical protein
MVTKRYVHSHPWHVRIFVAAFISWFALFYLLEQTLSSLIVAAINLAVLVLPLPILIGLVALVQAHRKMNRLANAFNIVEEDVVPLALVTKVLVDASGFSTVMLVRFREDRTDKTVLLHFMNDVMTGDVETAWEIFDRHGISIEEL